MLKKLHFQSRLEIRKDNGQLRLLPQNFEGIDFSSNDYLSLNNEPLWINYLKKEIPEEYIYSSLSSSRLVSGNSKIKEDIEAFFAQFYMAEQALFFPSGFNANLSIFSTIASKYDTIIYDAQIHASIREGIQLSFAHSIKFKHNDTKQLEDKIKRAKGQVYVAVESVYSMNGECAPLIEISALCKKYNALLIVDEAHSTGLFDKLGRGLCYELGIQQDVFIRLMTFGKAIGCHGAVVLGSKELITYFINYSKSFIYTTAPSTFDFIKAQKSVECIASHPEWIIELKKNINQFSNIINTIQDTKTRHVTPIIPFINPNIDLLKSFETLGKEHQYKFKSILSPTVSQGQERIRFSIQRSHSNDDFIKIRDLLKSHF